MGALLYQHNAPAHKSRAAIAAIYDAEFELEEPSLLTHLALPQAASTCFLKLKQQLSGRTFRNDKLSLRDFTKEGRKLLSTGH